MKTRLLAGLIAVALGGLTSCSNILEENGVINNVAESGMGELRIDLVADGTLNAMTKATPDFTSILNEIKVTLSVKGEVTIPSGTTLPNKTLYSEVQGKTYLLYKDTQCNLTAEYGDKMTQGFGWDCPHFYGASSTATTIVANNENSISANCTLQNSIVSINIDDLTKDSRVSVESITGYYGEPESSFAIYGDANTSSKNITNNILYVAADQKASLVLKGTFTPTGSNTPINFETPKRNLVVEGAQTTASKKDYKVTYALSDTQGQIKITVTLEKDVDEVSIPIIINPYDKTTNTPAS